MSHESDQETLIARLREQAELREDELALLRERLGAAEHELEDLRAIRDASSPRPSSRSVRASSWPRRSSPPPSTSAATSTSSPRARRTRPC